MRSSEKSAPRKTQEFADVPVIATPNPLNSFQSKCTAEPWGRRWPTFLHSWLGGQIHHHSAALGRNQKEWMQWYLNEFGRGRWLDGSDLLGKM